MIIWDNRIMGLRDETRCLGVLIQTHFYVHPIRGLYPQTSGVAIHQARKEA